MKRDHATAQRERDADDDREHVAGEDLLRGHPGAAGDDLVALPELGPHLRRRRQQVLLDAEEPHREFPQQEQQQRRSRSAPPRLRSHATAADRAGAARQTGASRRHGCDPRRRRRVEIPVPYSAGTLISMHLEVVGARDDVVRARRPAATGRRRRCTVDVALDAGEAEREPAAQHVDEVRRSCRASASRSAAGSGLIARMCLTPMRPPVAAARPRSRYSTSARRPSRVKAASEGSARCSRRAPRRAAAGPVAGRRLRLHAAGLLRGLGWCEDQDRAGARPAPARAR